MIKRELNEVVNYMVNLVKDGMENVVKNEDLNDIENFNIIKDYIENCKNIFICLYGNNDLKEDSIYNIFENEGIKVRIIDIDNILNEKYIDIFDIFKVLKDSVLYNIIKLSEEENIIDIINRLKIIENILKNM